MCIIYSGAFDQYQMYKNAFWCRYWAFSWKIDFLAFNNNAPYSLEIIASLDFAIFSIIKYQLHVKGATFEDSDELKYAIRTIVSSWYANVFDSRV